MCVRDLRYDSLCALRACCATHFPNEFRFCARQLELMDYRLLGSSLESDGCEPDKSDFVEATMSRSEIDGLRVAADEGRGIEDRIRDEDKPLVDPRCVEDQEEDGGGDGGGVGVNPGVGASATVLSAEAARVRLERHAHHLHIRRHVAQGPIAEGGEAVRGRGGLRRVQPQRRPDLRHGEGERPRDVI